MVIDLKDCDRFVVFDYNMLESPLENEEYFTQESKGKSFTFKGLDSDTPFLIATFQSQDGLKQHKLVIVEFSRLQDYIDL